MPYETGTQTTPKALFDHIVSQLQSAAFMGAGNEWTLVYSYDGWGSAVSTHDRIVKSFLVPGPSGAGDFHVVLALVASTASNTSNFIFAAFLGGATPPYGGDTWISRGNWSSAGVAYAVGDVVRYSSTDYVCAQAHTSAASPTPSASGSAGIWISLGTLNAHAGAALSANFSIGSYYGKVWNGGPGDIKYWLMASASRVMFVSKSDNRYHFCYAGGIERIETASTYALPAITAANSINETDTYLNANNRNFPEGRNPVVLACPNNRTATGTEVVPFPRGDYSAPLAPVGRRPNGDYPLLPIWLAYNDSTSDERGLVGTMEGTYMTDTRDSASENIITIAGQDYLVVEDVYLGQGGQFLALKLA